MHISKIINYVKNEINFSQDFCEDNVFVTLRIEPILRIIENLEQSHEDILEITKENIKKDKIIDLMAEHIVSSAIVDDTVCAIKCDCETDIEEDCTHQKMLKCTKQYFKSKAEKE